MNYENRSPEPGRYVRAVEGRTQELEVGRLAYRDCLRQGIYPVAYVEELLGEPDLSVVPADMRDMVREQYWAAMDRFVSVFEEAARDAGDTQTADFINGTWGLQKLVRERLDYYRKRARR